MFNPKTVCTFCQAKFNPRSHALRGKALLDNQRPFLFYIGPSWFYHTDAERPPKHSHAERGNERK